MLCFNIVLLYGSYLIIYLYMYVFSFSEELIEDKDLKEITFLSKDLIKLSNLCEKSY